MELPDLEEESRMAGGAHSRLYERVGALARKHGLSRGELAPSALLGPRAPSDLAAIHDVTRQVHAIEPAQRERHQGLFWAAGLLAGHAGEWHDALDMLGDATRTGGPLAKSQQVWEAILLLAMETRQVELAKKAHDRLRDLAPWSAHVCPAGFEVVEFLRLELTGACWRVREASTGLPRVVQLVNSSHADQSDLMLQIHGSSLMAKDHPAAERLVSLGKSEQSTRLVRVSEAWEGRDIGTEISLRGPIPVGEAADLAWHLVQGVLSLHRRGMIHRGITPGRVLVWKTEGDKGSWRCRVIGADLVPRRAILHAWAAMDDVVSNSASLDSALEFARWLPPETKGRPKGIVWQGPIQDVFGIGRVLLYALTGSDKPKGDAMNALPEDWRAFLGEAGHWLQAKRITTVEDLVVRLTQLVGEETRQRLESETDSWKRSELESMAAAEPSNAEAFRGLGRYWQAKEYWQPAADAYSRAIEIDDTDSSTRVGRGQCHSSRRRPDLAEADFRRAREISPDRVANLVSLVGVLRQRYRETEALALLDEAIAKQGSEFSLHMERGLTLRALERHDGAEESFARAARLQPANPYPNIFRSRSLSQAGRPREALATLQSVMPLSFLLDPDERAAMFLEMSIIRRSLGSHEESLSAADEASEAAKGLENSQLVARIALARVMALASLNRFEEALESFTALLSIPEGWPTEDEGVDSLSVTGAPTEAMLSTLDALIECRPDHGPVRRMRAMMNAAMLRDGRGEGLEQVVIRDIEAAREQCPPPAHVRKLLVEMLVMARRHDEALAEVDRCLAEGVQGPWKAERRRVLAAAGRLPEALKGCADFQLRHDLQALAGCHAEAMISLENAITKKSSDPSRWTALGDALAAAGQWERARNAIRSALSIARGDESLRMRLAVIHISMDRPDLVFSECFPPPVEQAADGWVSVLLDALINSERFEEAAGFLEKLQGDGVDANWLAFKWLNLMRMRGNREGVMSTLHEVMNLPPGDPAMLEMLADQDAADGDHAHAISLVDRVLKARPAHLPSLSRKALLLARVNRWQEAIGLQRQVVERLPFNPLPINNLAWMLAKAPRECGGDPAEAVGLAERACALTLNENPNALDTLAEALLAKGLKSRAVSVTKKAIAIKEKLPRPDAGKGATLESLKRRLEEATKPQSRERES